MLTAPFLQLVLDRLEAAIAPEYRPWHARIRHRMLQVHYGNPRVHYELWLQTKGSRVEIGLHFEDDRAVNQRWCSRLSQRVFELHEALGPWIELEEWTASWTRLHFTVPIEPLEPEYAASLAGQLGSLIAATADLVRTGIPEERLAATR